MFQKQLQKGRFQNDRKPQPPEELNSRYTEYIPFIMSVFLTVHNRLIIEYVFEKHALVGQAENIDKIINISFTITKHSILLNPPCQQNNSFRGLTLSLFHVKVNYD